MNILLLGGSGFIGGRVAALLRKHGHNVTTAHHHELNLLNLAENQAKVFLNQKDVVVNCVGVMHKDEAILETIHHYAPVQLAQWAAECGVQRWVQLSALGACESHSVAFVGSKGRGDMALCASGLQVAIARPSLVFGRGGASCSLFLKLAQLPVIGLPNGGKFDFQPVHVDDVAQGLVALVEHSPEYGTVIDFTGNQRLTFADYLSAMRVQFHHAKPLKVIPIPIGIIQPFLPIANVLSNGFLSADNMILLQEGSCADNEQFAKLLGRKPLAVKEFYL